MSEFQGFHDPFAHTRHALTHEHQNTITRLHISTIQTQYVPYQGSLFTPLPIHPIKSTGHPPAAGPDIGLCDEDKDQDLVFNFRSFFFYFFQGVMLPIQCSHLIEIIEEQRGRVKKAMRNTGLH